MKTAQSHTIPRTMRAVVLERYQENLQEAIRSLQITTRPVPELQRGQVLVKVEAAPCNPSDLLLLCGKYGTLKTLPTVPGWECAGTVVASGGGLVAFSLRGSRVACANPSDRDGTWAEYVAINAGSCIPLRAGVRLEQGASLIINPLTAAGLLDQARRGGHRAAVQTAGASQLGRMLVAMAKDQRFPLISVVRREEQVQLLRGCGAEHVLDSSREDFLSALEDVCERLDVSVLFDAVGGEGTGRILGVLPPGSVAIVYGALSEEACGAVNPIDLIFHGKSVTGFYLGDWLRRRGKAAVYRAASRVQRMLAAGQIETKIQRHVKLDEVVEGLLQYTANMTAGKVLIRPC